MRRAFICLPFVAEPQGENGVVGGSVLKESLSVGEDCVCGGKGGLTSSGNPVSGSIPDTGSILPVDIGLSGWGKILVCGMSNDCQGGRCAECCEDICC